MKYSLLSLAEKFVKVAGAGERVWIVLYVVANSDHMVQGVFSSEEAANTYMKSQAIRPDLAQRLLVKSYVIDDRPMPEAPAAPAGPVASNQ